MIYRKDINCRKKVWKKHFGIRKFQFLKIYVVSADTGTGLYVCNTYKLIYKGIRMLISLNRIFSSSIDVFSLINRFVKPSMKKQNFVKQNYLSGLYPPWPDLIQNPVLNSWDQWQYSRDSEIQILANYRRFVLQEFYSFDRNFNVQIRK